MSSKTSKKAASTAKPQKKKSAPVATSFKTALTNESIPIPQSLQSGSSGHVCGAAQNSVRQRTLFQSYTALPRTTRLVISGSLVVFGMGGMWLSDYLEHAIPASQKAQNATPSTSTPSQPQSETSSASS